ACDLLGQCGEELLPRSRHEQLGYVAVQELPAPRAAPGTVARGSLQRLQPYPVQRREYVRAVQSERSADQNGPGPGHVHTQTAAAGVGAAVEFLTMRRERVALLRPAPARATAPTLERKLL